MAEDKQINQQQIGQAQKSLLIEQEQLKAHSDKLATLEPKYSEVVEQLSVQKQGYQNSHQELVNQQQLVQQYHQKQESQNQIRLEETRRKAQLEETIEQKRTRLLSVNEQINAVCEQSNNTEACPESELILLAEQYENLTNQQQIYQDNVKNNQQAIWQLNQQKSDIAGTRSALERQIEQLANKLSQQTDWQGAQTTWLDNNKVRTLGALQQQLVIDEGWELAIEIVLSHKLQALLTDEFPLDEQAIKESPQSFLVINHGVKTNSKVNSLAEKVQGSDTINGLLNHVLVAENYQEAIKLLPQLQIHESVICAEGIWLSHHFIHRGLFSTKNEHFIDGKRLAENKAQLISLNQEYEAVIQQISCLDKEQNTLSVQLEEVNCQMNKRQQQLADLKQLKALAQQKAESDTRQRQYLLDEQRQLEQSIEQTSQALSKLLTSGAKIDKSDNEKELSDEVTSLALLTENLQTLQEKVQYHQTQQQLLTTEKHQMELMLEKTKNAESLCQQNIVRFQESIKQLTDQQNQNVQLLDENVNPLIADEKQLQKWLSAMVTLDNQLIEEQKTLSETQEIIQAIEQKQRYNVEDTNKLKKSLNQLHLDAESDRLKAQSAQEQLHELGQTVKSVQDAMPENARESQWQAQLIKLAKDLQMLGAINLAAIEEFETQLTRKNYLDQQDQDLNLAITTLESAIEKIDKESRHKFKITFDKVNQDLQSLFPKVFGGGQAYLTLTGDDLLDTGVTIMARPPGKKNSTIHLLSGGEKALTALSLVFAIFRLNPAPFCMLDEVDAPLDDANVSRFCNLVKEMSQTVQFIYISHNKIAMEMASHLTGVTMVEAGVSRMVAVDIDEAVAMAEVS